MIRPSRRQWFGLSAALVICGVVGACQTLTLRQTGASVPATSRAGVSHVRLAVMTASVLGPPVYENFLISVVPVSNAASDISLSSARIGVTSLQMTGEGCRSSAGPSRACGSLPPRSSLAEIPLSGEVGALSSGDVPTGIYTALRVHLGAPRPAQASAGHGPSIRVAGTFTDSSGHVSRFVFRSALDREIVVPLPNAVRVGPDGVRVTLAADVYSWFRDTRGRSLNPGDPRNAPRIHANILRSFQTFEDENSDGMSDTGSDG